MATSKRSVHQPARLKRKPNPPKPIPPREEWDFQDKVKLPDRELKHCLYYEYAREQATSSTCWRGLVAVLWGTGGNKRRYSEICKPLSAVFGGSPVWSIFFEERFLTTPWQSLNSEERRRFCKEQIPPRLESLTRSIALNLTLARDLPEYSAVGATDFESWRLLDQCFHTEQAQREHGFLAVNWDYTDNVLEQQFKAWLDESRGKRKSLTSQQGKSKPRALLKALGAKRLLDAGLPADDARKHTESVLGSGKPLYGEDCVWSRQKTRSVPAVLTRLFDSANRNETGGEATG